MNPFIHILTYERGFEIVIMNYVLVCTFSIVSVINIFPMMEDYYSVILFNFFLFFKNYRFKNPHLTLCNRNKAILSSIFT